MFIHQIEKFGSAGYASSGKFAGSGKFGDCGLSRFRFLRMRFMNGIARIVAAAAMTTAAMAMTAAAIVVGGMPGISAQAQAPSDKLSDEQHQLIRELFSAFPDAESLQSLRARITYTIRQRTIADLHSDSSMPFFCETDGAEVVEFSDYRCGYCKRMFPLLLEEKTRVKVVEFPVLGEMSVRAARLALAARKQGGYADFHIALMQKGKIDEDAFAEAAAAAGLDFARLQQDADGADISEALQKNRRFASALGVRGTPFLVIGDRTVPGAVNAERLQELLQSQQ